MSILPVVERLRKSTRDDDKDFEVVVTQITQFLGRYLLRFLPQAEDREDAVSRVVANLWRRRTELDFPSEAAWWSYIARAGRNAAFDIIGKKTDIDCADYEMSDTGYRDLEALVGFNDLRQKIWEAADALWLDLGSEPAGASRELKLLAAQLVYLHGLPPPDVFAILSIGSDQTRAWSAWLASEPAARALAFLELHYPNDRLVSKLLESQPVWDENEIRIIHWRYGNGLLTEKILQMAPGLTRTFVEDTLSKCRELLPFRSKAEKLFACFVSRGFGSKPLSAPGLYKRLAFQYHIENELPHRQILERSSDPADVAGYKLTDGMLNVWLSNGRLLSQLVAHMRRSYLV